MRGLTAWPVARVVQWAIKHPLVTLAVSVALAVVSAIYAAHAFNMTSDTAALISEKVAWRQREKAFQAAFPHNGDATVIVIDGATPELAESAASRLAAALEPQKDFFLSVERPDGGPFFGREALLYLSAPEVEATTAQLITAQPFLGALAADPSLRGVMDAVSAIAQGVTNGDTDLAKVDKPIAALGTTLSAVAAGKTPYFSWQKMIASDGNGGLKSPTRRFVIVHGRLGYDELMPGAESSEQIRATARTLALDAAHGVSVRLTGSVPLSDEEFASLQDRAWLVTSVMLAAVLVMLWLAVRSKRLVAAILVTTIIGLILTAAVGLAVVGRFNLISVAFVPLFVGLGVDFAIQFCVRYRAEAREEPKRLPALIRAGAGVGQGLALAAAAMALGFFAFLPTDYKGLAELGAIAGVGMVVALLLSITFLPAALMLLRPANAARETGLAALRRADGAVSKGRAAILLVSGVAALASSALSFKLNVNFDPLRLRSSATESVSTYRDIARDPSFGAEALELMAPDLTAARALAARLRQAPEVGEVLYAESLIPPGQADKLAVIRDAANILDLTINPFDVAPPPSDAEQVTAMLDAVRALRALAAQSGPTGATAANLADTLERLAKGPSAARARLATATTAGLPAALDQVRALLTAHEVDLATLPAEVKQDWISAKGQARVEVIPAARYAEPAHLPEFVRAVRSIAPNAVGPSVMRIEVRKLILGAFGQAAAFALATIVVLLLVTLRRISDVLLTLAPVLLSAALTAATCVVLRQDINLENLIALPLLLGIGVSFSIYFVVAWRNGARRLLASSLARAILFSAATTGAAFGALALSQHPGTASLGILLLISLFWTLVTTLLVLPALLSAVRPASAPSAR